MNSGARPLAIISGGSRGLGYESARGLAAAGFDLALIAKDQSRLEGARQSLLNEFANSQAGLTITTHAVDLGDQVATRNMATQMTATLATPKVLILAHGVMSEKMSKTLRTTDAEWNRVININLNSVFILVNAIAPAMADARDGRIVIYSACLGRMSGPGNAGGLAPYRISKAGVNALVRNLAHETGLGARGFYVDAICPNHTRTDMGGPDAPRSVEEGAETAIWLATADIAERGSESVTGVFWEDRRVIPW
ncbi:KR domain-containing protein [Actinobacteria bacterium IMCC26103]|nr:KR domain-containing protein [Actinobacteria bacterium IMCC26103]